jgi:TPP-dependent pyruvate/acetoin dehydrogenase alpha subunit
MRRDLHALGMLDNDADDRIQRDCMSVVEAAVEQARTAPSPEPGQSLDNVLAGKS